MKGFIAFLYANAPQCYAAMLTSAPGGREWSLSRFSPLNPEEEITDNYWIGGLVGPTASLDVVKNRTWQAICVSRNIKL
jgi:hypothetical protein